MCPFPNEGLGFGRSTVTVAEYLDQLDQAFELLADHETLAVYNDGSFFSERELPRVVRSRVYEEAVNRGVHLLQVESLPEFITEEALAEAREALGSCQLMVGIGLQSSSRTVRELCVNSPVTEDAFLTANNLLKDAGCLAKAYIMVKPPFLSEGEAINDAISSVIWLADRAVDDVTLCPTRIVEGTLLWDMYDRGHYRPMHLSSLVEVLRRLGDRRLFPRVSLSNVASDDLRAVTLESCEACGPRLLRAVEAYNVDPSSVQWPAEPCEGCCPTPAHSTAVDETELLERVHRFIAEAYQEPA